MVDHHTPIFPGQKGHRNIEETEWEPISYPEDGEAQVAETFFVRLQRRATTAGCG